MARSMYEGDTWPPLYGEAADETGSPVDLSTALSLEVRLISPTHTITGTPVVDQPPIADADGVHHWNWHYNWIAGDTANPGTYAVLLVVTWAPGEVQTFPNSGSETLTINPPPT